jgi:hypothetical protein
MGEAAEKKFYADTPHAKNHSPHPNIGKVAEDVVVGLKIALAVLDKDRPDTEDWQKHKAHHDELMEAVRLFTRFLDASIETGHIPHLKVGQNDVEAIRLGVLAGNEKAFFDHPVLLRACQNYPINYHGEHIVFPEFSSRDTLPGSLSTTQIYIGYVDDEVGNIEGYAVSINHFLALLDDGAQLGTEPWD